MDKRTDIEFLTFMFGMMGKEDFKRFVNIIANCDGRTSNLSRCRLNCYNCIYEGLLNYEVKDDRNILCVDDNVNGITKDKSYIIKYISVKDDGIFYELIDDYGIINQFKSCRFINVTL